MKTLIGNSDVLAENIFVYQLLVEKVPTYLLSKNDDEKSRLKSGIKVRNWAGDETALLSEILMDPMNGFLQTLESKALIKAPTREVFASTLQVLNEVLTKQGLAIKKIL